jgi:SAM-dependent methyltransferase
MSFSAVDAVPDPERLVAYLDETALGQAGIKHYVVAAHALRRPTRPILDVGCGVGHDLALLAAAGLSAIGIDPSAAFLRVAADRIQAPRPLLAQAAGAAPPFPAGVFGGCRMERVLQHVPDPASLVLEAVRCLQPGGQFTLP